MGRRELGNAETAFRKWEESLLWARIPWKKWSSHHNQQNSLKCSTWMQSQKWQNDLYSFPRQTIQYHSNPNLCPKQKCWRSWSWMVLLRPTRPFRTNTPKRCPFHYRGLEWKGRKSRNTWSNRQIWPWNMEWSKEKANRVLPRELANTLFQQHKRRLYTWTSPDG